jgi:hypothetical protein
MNSSFQMERQAFRRKETTKDTKNTKEKKGGDGKAKYYQRQPALTITFAPPDAFNLRVLHALCG